MIAIETDYKSKWVLSDEILADLSITSQTLRNWIEKQLFPKPAMTIGKRHYWCRESLEMYYAERRRQALSVSGPSQAS